MPSKYQRLKRILTNTQNSRKYFKHGLSVLEFRQVKVTHIETISCFYVVESEHDLAVLEEIESGLGKSQLQVWDRESVNENDEASFYVACKVGELKTFCRGIFLRVVDDTIEIRLIDRGFVVRVSKCYQLPEHFTLSKCPPLCDRVGLHGIRMREQGDESWATETLKILIVGDAITLAAQRVPTCSEHFTGVKLKDDTPGSYTRGQVIELQDHIPEHVCIAPVQQPTFDSSEIKLAELEPGVEYSGTVTSHQIVNGRSFFSVCFDMTELTTFSNKLTTEIADQITNMSTLPSVWKPLPGKFCCLLSRINSKVVAGRALVSEDHNACILVDHGGLVTGVCGTSLEDLAQGRANEALTPLPETWRDGVEYNSKRDAVIVNFSKAKALAVHCTPMSDMDPAEVRKTLSLGRVIKFVVINYSRLMCQGLVTHEIQFA